MKYRKGRPITIDYYRWAGRFLFFRVKNRCMECDMTYVLLNRLMAETFGDRDITLRIRPWLNNIWHLAFRGVWHAPAVLVNHRIFSMKTVPRANELIRHIARLLDDPELENAAERFVPGMPAALVTGDTVVYHSPSCPHCRQLIGWLESRNIDFVEKNVQDHPEYRDEMLALTGTLVIPVLKHRDEVVSGFDRKRIRGLLSLPEDRPEENPSEGQEISVGGEPGAAPEVLARTLADAKRLLEENRSERWTRASHHLYPHQWNWDAGFISRGYLSFDPPRAYQEMDSLKRKPPPLVAVKERLCLCPYPV